ncbi:MAG: hypothetical protein IKA61_06475 [Clostridia bacterium]|nr:hypothetical protein [Clostridia bacterium]
MGKSILKVMMIIIDRNKTEKLLSKLEQLGVNFPHVFRAEGTAKSELLDVLGVGHSEKSIVFSTVTQETVIKVKEILTNEFDILKKGNGIAFTIPITSVGGPATLQILSGMNLTGGKL